MNFSQFMVFSNHLACCMQVPTLPVKIVAPPGTYYLENTWLFGPNVYNAFNSSYVNLWYVWHELKNDFIGSDIPATMNNIWRLPTSKYEHSTTSEWLKCRGRNSIPYCLGIRKEPLQSQSTTTSQWAKIWKIVHTE